VSFMPSRKKPTTGKEQNTGLDVNHALNSNAESYPQEMKVMWNSRTYAAMAIAGAGLALAVATPASAWWPGYGSAGCGYYGAAYGPGSLSYGAGTFTYGWPYVTNVIPYPGYGSFGYAPAYGFGFGNSPAYGLGASYGYAPAYGSGYSYAPAYGYGGSGCGRGHRVRGYGYATASRRHYNFAVASYLGPAALAEARLRPLRVGVANHHDVAIKPVHGHVASRNNLKLARAD
jgi:hypothetical protein